MKENLKQIIIILIVSLILMLPMYFREYKLGDDTGFHVANITATIESMDNFVPTDILPNVAKNFGYATRQFYPLLGHTITAYLSKITTISVTNSLKIMHNLILFASGITMYFLALKLCKKKNLALLSSIIYMTFPYQLSDIYVRDAFAESLIFIFIPLILNALTELFKNKKKFILMFTLGYVGGMLSHLTMMIYATLLLIPFFIINYKKVFKKETLITLFTSAFLILAITSPVIITMFQNKLFGNYRVFVPGVMAQGIQHSGLWIDFINYFGIFDFLTYNSNGISYYLNLVVLFLLILLIKKHKEIDFKNYKFILWFLGLSIIASSIIFPWDLLPQSIRIIQFPWRFMTFVSIGISLLIPLVIPKIKIDQRILTIFIILFALICNTNYYNHETYDTNNVDYSLGLGWQKEYLPNNTYNNIDYYNNRTDEVLVSSGKSTIIKNELTNLEFNITENAEVELPRLFYFGYNLYDESNNLISIYEDEYGFIKANLNKGTYILKYEQIKAVKIAKIISVASLVILLGYCLIPSKKTKVLYFKPKKRYNINNKLNK